MRVEQATAYVESLLYRFVGGDRIVADHDGDYRVWFRNCLYFVRVIGHDVAVVQVFAVAVADVDVSPALLSELNTLNSEIQFARACHLRQQILIETDVLAEDFSPATFENACSHVETVTLEMAPSLAARFGGRLTFANRLTLATAPGAPGAPGLAGPTVLSEGTVLAETVLAETVLAEAAALAGPPPTDVPALTTTSVVAGTPEPAGIPEPATAEEPAAAPAPATQRAPAKTRAPRKRIHDVPTGQHL